MQLNRLAGGVLAAICLVSGAFAQDAPQMMRVGMYKLKPGGAYGFQEALKVINKAAEAAGVPWRETWATTLFGEAGTYVTVSPVKNFAQFDRESAVAKMSPEDRAKYTTLMSNSVESAQFDLEEMRPAISLDSKRQGMPKLMRVMVVDVKPGKALEFEELIKGILPLYQKAGVKDYWVTRTVVGGKVSQYTLLLPFDSWAQMDSIPAGEKLLGSAVAYKQYLAKVAECVDSGETMVVRSLPELSYRKGM